MTAAPRAALEIKLRSLKLPSFVAHHGEVAGQAETGGWPFDQFLDALTDLELEERTRRRIERVLKASHLPADKTLATLDLARLPPALPAEPPRARTPRRPASPVSPPAGPPRESDASDFPRCPGVRHCHGAQRPDSHADGGAGGS